MADVSKRYLGPRSHFSGVERSPFMDFDCIPFHHEETIIDWEDHGWCGIA